MSQETAINFNPNTGAPVVRRTLSGLLAVRFGALPIVPLPGEDEPLMGFVRDAGDILKDKGLYRRDRVIVVSNDEKKRLDEMTPEVFCTWAQRHFMTAKIKYDSNDEPYEVIKDMPTDAAMKTLGSLDFIPLIPEIEKVLPVPMPFITDEGIKLTCPGFDPASKTITYTI